MYHTPDPETLSAEGGTPDVENSSQDSNAEPSGATDPDVGSDADSRLAPVTDSAYALGYDDADAAVAGQPVRNRPKRRSVSAETGSSGEPNGQVAGEEAASPYSMQRVMEETIAQLQAALQQKDEELLQTTLAATNFKETLEQTKTRSEHLRKKLTTVVKAHETLSQKVASGAVPIVNGGRAVPESEVAQMKEQWRVAQKSFEREHNRIRGELAKTRTQAHQVAQELEVQTRARRAEEAHASLRVANLERNLQTAKTVVAAEESQSGSWMKLAATAVVTAIVMIAFGFWWQSSHPGAEEAARQAQVHDSASPRTPAAPVTAPPSVLPSATSQPSPAKNPEPSSGGMNGAPAGSAVAGQTLSAGIMSRGAFQKALSRLNNVLYGPVGATPEQILRTVREENAKTNPNVCNFQWNNGQPALYFGGAQTSLESSLDQCASAVELFLKQPTARSLIARR
jgi:hypothetical protein